MIVVAPLIAILAFASLTLVTCASQASQASSLRDLASVCTHAGALSHQLQRERGDAVALLTLGSTELVASFRAQATETDAAVIRFLERDRRAARGSLPDDLSQVSSDIDDALASLQETRDLVESADQVPTSTIAFHYQTIISRLRGYRSAVTRFVSSAELANDIRAAAFLTDALEYLGQQQVIVLRALPHGTLSSATHQELLTTSIGFDQARSAFLDDARPLWRTWWKEANDTGEAVANQRLEALVMATRIDESLTVDGELWEDTTEDWCAVLFALQERIDNAITQQVREVREDILTEGVVALGGIVLTVLLTFLVTTVVASEITRQLRALRNAANLVAFERLPTMVKQLQGSSVPRPDPDEVATLSAEAIRASFALAGTEADEIGQVAQAFAEVHRAAVRTAMEQVALRASTSQVFIHLSRRGQRLVDTLLAQVDVVERDETHPDRLKQLYELDNLATRMARTNASLLVLGGAGSCRVRREDIPLRKVLQAALSQIRDYARVRVDHVDHDVTVASDAVDDVVHLFAELMDNATTYSPPSSEAWVTARSLEDRVMIQIGDDGVGLPEARRRQLNQTLAQPPTVDMVTVSSMGLVVVGYLAERLGVRVELLPGPRCGTTANVLLTPQIARRVSQDDAEVTRRLPAVPAAATAAVPPLRQPSVAAVGLPQRVPMGQLIPSPPDLASCQRRSDQRDPSAVASALAAYARGVSGRRYAPTAESTNHSCPLTYPTGSES